jgi:hypothetical protein
VYDQDASYHRYNDDERDRYDQQYRNGAGGWDPSARTEGRWDRGSDHWDGFGSPRDRELAAQARGRRVRPTH